MESDLGKLFIGGISWNTNEDRLREYFMNFGEVVEAVIMKDRTTGRARGFGFVVFKDPAVAERVIMKKHQIDGRMVEAKKAIPRDDQRILLNRKNNSLHGTPSPLRTKKIFVGGLPSTLTEAEFKKYFERFGPITDVVVMYDHNTQRPRGFGFITFNSEDVVDRVLHKNFYEINGKMVEVKKAIPKELSPGPSMRPPVGGHNYGLDGVNNFLNLNSQGYNPSSLGSYDLRLDNRFGPVPSGRKESPLIPGYEIGLSFESGLSTSYGENLNLSNNVGYGQALSPYYSGNATRFASPIGYNAGGTNPGSSISSGALNLWDNGDLNFNIIPASANSFATSGIGSFAGFDNNNINWQGLSSPSTAHAMISGSGLAIRNLSYGARDNTFGLSNDSYARSNDIGSLNTSFAATRNLMDSYGSGSIYRDLTWHSTLNELDGSSSFGYELGAAASDVIPRGSIDYMNGYDVTNRHINRGISGWEDVIASFSDLTAC